ncbi:MAG: hypothetical protein IKB02_01535 [Clostridia bacterium]|nr:hypothetical protein [Clostridia bacterium]
MKKLLAITLACLMMLTLCASVSAADGDVNVTVTIEDVVPILMTEVSWDSFDFTYTFKETWTEGSFEVGYDEVGWNKPSATVTVANKSAGDVNVKISYEPKGDVELPGTVDFAMTAVNQDLSTAEGRSEFDSVSATLTVSGVPTVDSADTFNSTLVGNVVVEIVEKW